METVLAQKSEQEQMLAEQEAEEAENSDEILEEIIRPQIHFEIGRSEDRKVRQTLRSYRMFRGPFNSETKVIRGATTESDLRSLNLELDLY